MFLRVVVILCCLLVLSSGKMATPRPSRHHGLRSANPLPTNPTPAPRIPTGFSWQNCSTNPHFAIGQVIMTPYPVVPGQNVTIHAHGYQDETVSSGTWVTKTYFHGIEVESDTGSVCDLIPNCRCPCPAGWYTASQSLYVTSLAPSGTYTGVYKATDQKGAVLACINYSFDMS